MIELSLSKLVLIGIVALLVIGPDKLPDVAKKAGTLFGRSRRWMDDLRSEIGRDLNLHALNGIGQTVREAAQDIHGSLSGIGLSSEAPAVPISRPTAACSHAARARRFRMRKMEKASLPARRKPLKCALAARRSFN